MKYFKIVLLGFVFCVFNLHSQPAYKIYVSVKGSDFNTGEKNAPVKTLQRAKQLIMSHRNEHVIDIILADGTYYLGKTLKFNSNDFETNNCIITFKAENKRRAIISGGKRLFLDWKLYRDHIFKASLAKHMNIDQLFVNGNRQRMARFPNAIPGKNVFDTWDLKNTTQPDPKNDPLSKERIARWKYPAGGYVHAMQSSLWGDMAWLIKGKNKDSTLELEGGWQNNRPSPMHPRYRFVENIFEELDAPNEWYYNKEEGTLYYYPEKGVDLSKVEAKIEIVLLKRKYLIELNGSMDKPVKNIHFEDLVFTHASRSFMENKEPLLRSDWTIYRGGAILFNGAENCSILNCEFDQLGGNSIFVNDYNTIVR